MKTKIYLAMVGALVVSMPVVAEHNLPAIIVEGGTIRSGAFAAAPDSSGLKDTAALLKRVPGANVNRNGPLTGVASYRGMYGNRINIAINGANMKEVGPNSMDPPLSHIPAPLTGALTIYRGIAPIDSGIESFGGSMQVKSKKGDFSADDSIKTSGNASSGYSSAEDGYYGTLLGSVANQNHKLYLSGSKEQGRDYRIKNNQKQPPTQYDREAYTTGYAYQRGAHEFAINYSNNATGHTGTPALPMDIDYVRGGLYDTSYSWKLAGYQLKTKLFYQKMRHQMSNSLFRPGGTQKFDAISNHTRVEAGGIDLAFILPLFGGNLSLGVNGDHANHDALIKRVDTSPTHGGSFTPPAMRTPSNTKTVYVNPFNDIERDRYSIFTQWQGNLSQDLKLELGSRFTHTWMHAGDVSGGKSGSPNPMVARIYNDRRAFNAADRKRNFNEVDLTAVLHYEFSPQLDLEVGFGRKNRAPTYQELYLFTQLSAVGGLADGNVYLGNLGLEHETAYQFDLSFDWRNAHSYITPRFFYHYVDDYIQGNRTARARAAGAAPGSPSNVLEFSNIQAQLFGLDLETGYTIDDNWSLDAGLNYVRGMRVNSPTSDDDLYRIAPLNGRAQVSYEHQDWMGAIEGVFYADQGDVIGYRDGVGNEQKTKGYMLLNLRGYYQPYRGITVGLGIENVIDSKHYDHLGGYQLHNRANGRVASPGRNVYTTLSYNW